jgi:CHAD domain-containing protein
MNVRSSYDGLWRKRLDALDKVWPEFVAGETDALHKARVASRRIREALPVVGVEAPAGKVKKLRRKMRDLTRLLGPIRELDVELGMIESDVTATDVSPSALALVRREVTSRRQALRRKLKEDKPRFDLKKVRKKLEKIAKSSGDQKTAWRTALAATLMKRAKGLKIVLDEAGPLYTPERIHGVRVAVKKLRYALEIARDAGQSGIPPLLKALKREQDRLGHLHDLESLLSHVRDAASSQRSGSRQAELTAYADTLERDIRRLHAQFVEARETLFESATEVRQNLVPSLMAGQLHQASATETHRRPRARAARQA